MSVLWEETGTSEEDFSYRQKGYLFYSRGLQRTERVIGGWGSLRSGGDRQGVEPVLAPCGGKTSQSGWGWSRPGSSEDLGSLISDLAYLR